MHIDDLKTIIAPRLYDVLQNRGITQLRPSQTKAIQAGLFAGKNLIVCTPTASGKTLIAEMACVQRILEKKGKAVYVVPLKALAAEKYKDFKKHYDGICKVAIASGDIDSRDDYLMDYDLIITTSEKLDSLIRHAVPWLGSLATIIIDEIHLLNDPNRGPTLEIVITTLKKLQAQIIGLSATIGNPQILSEWLDAQLVQDTWRPVPLKRGIYLDGEIEFYP